MNDFGLGLATSHEERVLRRRLLFRLLKDFDFAAPQFHGELITPPTAPDQDVVGFSWDWRN